MHDRPYKRRIMIVDREFQHRFIRRIAMLAVLIVVASLSLLAITYAVNLDVQTVIVQPLPLAISENAPSHCGNISPNIMPGIPGSPRTIS